jgi:hypothetical protein
MKIIRHPLFMRPHPDEELEHLIDRELRRLPELPAPATLMPRVMQAIAARQAVPWWRKSFIHWPVSARLAFLAGSSALTALLVYLVWGFSSGVSLGGLGSEIQPWLSGLSAIRSLLETLGSAALVLAKSASNWLMWSAITMAAVSYLTTVGLGTVCWRLATRRE